MTDLRVVLEAEGGEVMFGAIDDTPVVVVSEAMLDAHPTVRAFPTTRARSNYCYLRGWRLDPHGGFIAVQPE